MPVINGSYRGNTMAPQYKTYPTAGLLKPTPLPSVTPVPKGTTAPGSVVFDPPGPTTPTYQPPPVGPAAPTVPGMYDPAAQQQGAQQPDPSGRGQLVRAVMGRTGMAPQ